MKKIPKEIVEKIEERNRLNKEISKWLYDNVYAYGCNPESAEIVAKVSGREQGTKDCKEWCDQQNPYEDWYYGDYYWETECRGKFLKMHFDC